MPRARLSRRGVFSRRRLDRDNAKGRVGSHTAVLGDWGVRGSKSGDSTFASFAFEFSANCGLLADGGMHQAAVGLEATVCRDVGAAFGPRYPAIECGNKDDLGANFYFDLIGSRGRFYFCRRGF